MMKKEQRRQYKYSKLTDLAHRAMDWIGSVQSLCVHTVLFGAAFALVFIGYNFEKILLVVTTIVSLEAIYLAIFIQMAVNQNTQSLETVEEDIDEIQKDVDEIQEDVDEIQKGVMEMEKDIDEIQKDVDEMEESDEHDKEGLEKIEGRLSTLMTQIEKMKEGMR